MPGVQWPMSKKTVRHKFQGRARHKVQNNMLTETFGTRQARDDRWRELRAGGRNHIFRSSTSVGGITIWEIRHPVVRRGR